ncbi:MAG: hypothetical protein AB1578_11805 [Thermodesulfobacteriota bacterium]
MTLLRCPPAARLACPRTAARWIFAAMLVAAPAALAYVVPSGKVLERWVQARGTTVGPVELPVRWGEQEGSLYAAGPGRHALLLGGREVHLDAGPGLPAPGPLAALWRALDLFMPGPAQGLGASLEMAGVDLRRSGYARSARSQDGVALTLGAKGEGESALAQVHFARVPLWPLAVRFSGGEEVRLGEPGPRGWPGWFDLPGSGRIEVVGPPRESPTAPAWAARRSEPGGGPTTLPDWRRAFEGGRP